MDKSHETSPAVEYNPWGEDYLDSVPEFKGDEAPATPALPDALIDNLNTAIADTPLGNNGRPTLETIELRNQRDYAEARQADFDKLQAEHPEYSGEDGFLKYLDELLAQKRQSGESSLRRDQEIDHLEKLIDRLYHMTGRADAKFEVPVKPAESAEPEPESAEPKPESAKPAPDFATPEELESPEPKGRAEPAPEPTSGVPAVLAPEFPIPNRPRRSPRVAPTIDLPETPAKPRRPRRVPVIDFPESTPEKTPFRPEKPYADQWPQYQNDFLWRASTKFDGDLEAAYAAATEEEKRELELIGFLSFNDIVISRSGHEIGDKQIRSALAHLAESGPDVVPNDELLSASTRDYLKTTWRGGYEEIAKNDPETMTAIEHYVQQAQDIFGPESELYYYTLYALHGESRIANHHADTEGDAKDIMDVRKAFASVIANDIKQASTGHIQLDGPHGERFLIPDGRIPIERMLLAKYKNASPAPNPTPPRRRSRNPL
ncbi:hypothetical protein IJG98_03475 [Candidatus Saccharibacteria bacterium]|nr:hypothetical protein [Candidatus Saccharibacteria bacterium]